LRTLYCYGSTQNHQYQHNHHPNHMVNGAGERPQHYGYFHSNSTTEKNAKGPANGYHKSQVRRCGCSRCITPGYWCAL